MGQRTLFNFDVQDPFDAPTVDKFKDQFKRLNGRFPKGHELNEYYGKHPEEWQRKHGESSPAKKGK